jgi:hypothetical protein
LIVAAAGLALLIAYPQEVLLVMAYSYLASAFIGLAIHKLRGRGPEVTPPPEPSEV